MNERIKLLSEQCHHRYSEHNIDLEKFAQLIVKECAKVILETPVEYLEIDAMHRVRDRVKNHFNHFGVEE